MPASPTRRMLHDMVLCRHREHIRISQLPDAVAGCEECLAAGQSWLHLRICLECGHVGCCDDSPHQHANAHANATGHPIIRSLEPGEEWGWCYADRIGMLTPEVTGSTRIPAPPAADHLPSNRIERQA
jgi:uncharacterized UBP type Zn finger protein